LPRTIVAVDTTTPRGSVALLEEDEVRAELRMVASDSHSRWLAGAIELLVAGLGRQPQDVDGWAVATGPGSFTGLRVGLSTVQGLALASARPCVGVSSLDALAALVSGFPGTIVPLVNAFRDEVYWGIYDGEAHPSEARGVGPVETVLDAVSGPLAVLGDGASHFRARILGRRPDAVFPSVEPWLAVPLGRLAARRLAAGEGIDPGDLRPLYLRGADIRKATP
jgi:tRNA threonylcarbamoyladenosine biosynthesis protein TsaB